MTKLEVIQANKKLYADIETAINNMTDLEKVVAQSITLVWAKGVNWMGGVSDSKFQTILDRLVDQGYDEMELVNEFEKQVDRFLSI